MTQTFSKHYDRFSKNFTKNERMTDPQKSAEISEPQKFVLEADEELRINFSESKEEFIEIELTNGTAEIFGFELKRDVKYPLHSGCGNFSIFSFQGCKLSVHGVLNQAPQKCKENPMVMYLQVHAALEQMRKNVDENSKNEKSEEESLKGKIGFFHAFFILKFGTNPSSFVVF